MVGLQSYDQKQARKRRRHRYDREYISSSLEDFIALTQKSLLPTLEALSIGDDDIPRKKLDNLSQSDDETVLMSRFSGDQSTIDGSSSSYEGALSQLEALSINDDSTYASISESQFSSDLSTEDYLPLLADISIHDDLSQDSTSKSLLFNDESTAISGINGEQSHRVHDEDYMSSSLEEFIEQTNDTFINSIMQLSMDDVISLETFDKLVTSDDTVVSSTTSSALNYDEKLSRDLKAFEKLVMSGDSTVASTTSPITTPDQNLSHKKKNSRRFVTNLVMSDDSTVTSTTSCLTTPDQKESHRKKYPRRIVTSDVSVVSVASTSSCLTTPDQKESHKKKYPRRIVTSDVSVVSSITTDIPIKEKKIAPKTINFIDVDKQNDTIFTASTGDDTISNEIRSIEEDRREKETSELIRDLNSVSWLLAYFNL